ncbi:MAG: serine/threonine protein kinase [Deltaproteobacteria bacterium]|nr:serine/threonine protein kinase [Deltaproteobacteria bacterium]
MSEELLQPAAQDDPKVGMVLQDRYRIVRKIGEGGMGAVYEGEHVLIKRRVAIKCLHSQFATNPEIVARFHREALAATSIGHQNIIEVTDMGRFDDGSVFMVLEFLHGRDWSDDIDDNGAQPLQKTLHILDQVCDALTAAHAKGIIHRDLKPENIYLIERGNDPDFVKVLDFGISKFKDSSGGGKGMTQTGTTLGTPYYMAPEQAQGKKDIDNRADIYSLGVILFQALTGQYPFDDESYPMLVLKICTEPPPPLRLYRPDLPEELELLIAKLLAKDPSARFPDCESLKAALQQFRAIEDTPEVAADAPSTASMQSSLLTGAGQAPAQSGIRPPATAMHDSAPDVPVVPARSTMPLIVIGVLLMIAGGLGIAAAMGVFSSPEPEVPVAPPIPVATGETPEDDEDVEDDEPLAEERVWVRIDTEPADAELFLDGDRIANPFQARMPAQREPRRIEARKDGFVTQIQDLSLRWEQNLTIRLEEGSGTDDRREQRTTTSRRRRRGGDMAEAPMTSETAPTAMTETPTAMESPMVTEPTMAEPAATMTTEATMESSMGSTMMNGLLDINI